MMPQSQNAEFNNGSNNNAVGITIAPQNNQYVSNVSMPNQIAMLNSTIQNQNFMAAALHLNQSTQGYINPALATIGYIYPNNNSFVQASNLVFNQHNILHPPVEVLSSSPSSLGHISSSGLQHNHKLGGYDNIQHFGSLSQTPSRKPKNSVMSKTNLYINGLQENDTDESVRALVEGIIDPKSCKAMMSHGKCRGSGFIDCANENDAEVVIHTLRNKQMPGGTRLAVKFAYENEKDDLNVYVRNLPRTSNFNNNNLEEMFSVYGQVVSVKLLQSDNQYTGTGFVRFSNAEEAQKAVEDMNGKKLVLTEDDKPVICKLADKGGRRINHSMISCVDSVQSQSQGMDGGNDPSNTMVNGGGGGSTIPQISPENNYDKNGYGMSIMSNHQQQYQSQGHPWMSHSNTDQMLLQELQSLSLAQANANYLMPGLVQSHLTMPYGDEAAVAIQHQQQQQLLAHLIWSHHQQQQQQQRIPTAYHQSQVVQQSQHHQQQHQVPQAQPIIQWPPQVHQHPIAATAAVPNQNTNNNNIYYTAEHPYQSLIYPPPQQYRHSRAPVPIIDAALNSTVKSPPSGNTECAVVNGQTSSSNQVIVNGAIIDHQSQQH